MATPVEVWAPAWRWLPTLTPANTTATYSQGTWCMLCEQWVPAGAKAVAQHVRQHVRERQQYGQRKVRQQQREATMRLRALHREQALAKRVLGGAA